jgi:hypothetical protein
MKIRHIASGVIALALIAVLVPAIRAAFVKHRRSQEMAILQQIGVKMNIWSMDHEESFPCLTNESFLATLAPDETAFLSANKLTVPSGTNATVALQAQTQHGNLALYIDGSVTTQE